MPFIVNKFRGDGDIVDLEEIGVSVKSHFHFTSVGASAANAASTANGNYWTFGTDRHDYYVWYNVTGTNLSVSDPTVLGLIGVPVTVAVADMAFASEINDATVAALNKLSEIHVDAPAADEFRVFMRAFGSVTAPLATSAFGVGGVSASVFITAASVVSGVANDTVDVKHVVLGSAGNVVSLIDQTGSVWNVEASTYRISEINKTVEAADQGDIVASAGDTPTKSNNLVLSSDQRDSTASSLGGVV